MSKKPKQHLHVFSGKFESADEADEWSQADYSEDEDEPTCGFWDDIGCADVDPDGQEVIDGEDRFEYLGGMLVDGKDAAAVEKACPSDHNILILVFAHSDMNQGLQVSGPLSRVKYHGAFPFSFY